MSSHQVLQEEIPAYIARRLEGDTLRALEAHLADCPECTEKVRTGRALVSAMRAGGEELFAGHPDETTLREYAFGKSGADAGKIARHLATCASCELEVSAWKLREESTRRGLAPPGLRAPARAAPSARFHPLSLAAGLLVGVGAVLLLRPEFSPRAGAPAVTTPGAPALEWHGAAQLIVLTSPLRGEALLPAYRLDGNRPFVLFAVQPALADGAPDDATYRFEILGSGPSAIWSSDLTASEIRRHLEVSQVVTFPVPSHLLPPGRYTFQLGGREAAQAQPLLEIHFEVIR